MLRLQVLGFLLLVVITSARCDLVENDYPFKGTQTLTQEVDLEGVESIEIWLGSGDIKVIHGEKPSAIFEIEKTCRAKDFKAGQDLMAKTKLTFEKSLNRLRVEEVREDQSWRKSWTQGQVKLDITLRIPEGLELTLRTGSGDIEITRLVGRLSITSGSGDISIGTVKGDADILTGSGDLDLVEITGDLKFRTGSGSFNLGSIDGNLWVATGSGDILVKAARGDLSVKTASGSVSIGSHDGSLKITTASGDVTAQSGGSRGEIDIRTSSGSVDLVLIHSESIEVSLDTISGSISSNIPLEVKRVGRKALVGSAGNGDLKLRVTTVSGDIVIKQASV